MDIPFLLERAASLHGARPALLEGERTSTYADFARSVGAWAGWLREFGVQSGDRVALLDHNSAAYLRAYFAIAAVGAIAVPLNVRQSARELGATLADCEPVVLCARAELAPLAFELGAAALRPSSLRALVWLGDPPAGARDALAELVHASEAELEAARAWYGRASIEARQPAQLYYTSGTTGRPKGVVLTHENVCTHALAAIAELRLADSDTWGHIAPMFHLADAWACFALTWVGGRHAFLPRFEAGAALAFLGAARVSATNLVPAMLNLMVRHPERARHELSSLRLVMSGGAPIAPQVVREVIAAFGCEYVQTYGMTETSPYLTLSLLSAAARELPPERQFALRASTGRPFLAVELEVRGADGLPVARDGRSVGEICARGPTVTPGYWRQPQATAEAIRGGWLHTGDLAVVEPEGYLNIVDRAKDMIISGGEKVYSTEVEAALYEHPAVLEAAVYAVPDERHGEAVAAAIVLRAGASATADELQSFCRARLSGYKLPRRFEFLSELPRTGSGKLSKRALREPHWAARQPPVAR
jgi:fatty-acyl-CoA synthase